jgi:hypothetical protein
LKNHVPEFGVFCNLIGENHPLWQDGEQGLPSEKRGLRSFERIPPFLDSDGFQRKLRSKSSLPKESSGRDFTHGRIFSGKIPDDFYRVFVRDFFVPERFPVFNRITPDIFRMNKTGAGFF